MGFLNWDLQTDTFDTGPASRRHGWQVVFFTPSESRTMTVVTLFEKLMRPSPALLLAALIGCSQSDDDQTYYLGDEEAVREHMREVEHDERTHFQQTQAEEATVAGSVSSQMFQEGRPGGN